MPHMKMPIWTFRRHLAGLSLYPAPPRAEIAVAKSSHPLSVSFSTGGMSAYGMVRPCSCPASVLSWQGTPTTRSAPCLRYPRLSESISARTHSMLSATMSVVRSCCDRSGHAVILDLWQHYRALPADGRAKFMQVAAKWQEALLHWQDRDTLSFTLMVVACEALKPSDAAFNDHTIYEVVGALLGPEAEARLREHWFRPHNVRSRHLHLGQFHGSELTARTFVDSSYDPTFDQARRELFRVTQDAIIEWLRRRGEFELPRLTKRKTLRRRVRENRSVALSLAALLGVAVGWALHASLS